MKNATAAQWRGAINDMAVHANEYAGLPTPVEGQELVIHPSYKWAHAFNKPKKVEPNPRVKVRNQWRHTKGYDVYLLEDRKTGRIWHEKYPPLNRAAMVFNTMAVAPAWDLQAELKAQEKLRSLIPLHLFEMYLLTGSFLQTSKRSGLAYVFRRLRPTLVMTPHKGPTMQVLCCLCLHPIGYHKDTWGGCLVPTDEVVAHLLLMRGDEAEFWAQANQHPAWKAESGL